MGQAYDVWIEAEHSAPGQWAPRDSNSDVAVTFADGARWVATFFAYDHINTLRRLHQETGECLGGRYFEASDMVLVDEVTRERIEQVVAELIATEHFEAVFSGPHHF
jgi:hypothetical protein